MIDVNESTFMKEVKESDKPVLVDFWAPWCAPCKLMTPLIEEIETTYNTLKVVKINIDDNEQLANQWGIRGVPTLMLFKNGAVMNTLVGIVPKDRIVSFIRGVI